MAVVFSVLVGVWPGARRAVGQARRRKSPYSSLPQTELADSLSKLGMTELMSELMKSGDPGGAADVRVTAARALIRVAKVVKDPAEREAKLDEAIALLRAAVKAQDVDIVAAASPTKTAQATIKKMQTQLFMAVTQALTRGEPYANKLLFLQGAEADRKALDAATAGAAGIVRNLGDDIEELKINWRRDMRIWIVVARTVGGLEAEAKYRAGWIRFYHGMAARGTKVGRADLRAVEGLVEIFTDGSQGVMIQQQSELLIARSLRELGRHDVAAKWLEKVISGKGSADLHVDAEFERVRNLIESGRTLAKAGNDGNQKYNQVPAALNHFRSAAKKLAADDQSKRRVDMWATLLEHYFYETRSKTEKDTDKAADYGMKAQESLLGFLEKYTDEAVQNAFYDIIYRKYRDRKDYKNLSSAVLVAIASHEFNAARVDKKNTSALNAAKAVLAMVNKRSDKVSKRVRPMVLWQLAFIMNFEGDSFESAGFFAELATEFPDHKLAYQAATYAKDTIHYHYTHVPEIADNLREKYRDILLVYTGGKWGDKPAVRPWNFQLAEQLVYFAERKEQVEVKNAKTDVYNARIKVRDAELMATEAKNPRDKANAAARAKELNATVEQLEAKAAKIISGASAVYRKIARTYEKVPHEPHMAHMQARQRAMMYHKYVLDLYPAKTAEDRRLRTAEAVAMAGLLIKYSNDVRAALPNEKNPAALEDLKEWGSKAKLLAIELLFDHGGSGQSGRAMRELENMAKEWPGALILQQSEDLRIRKVVEAGRIDDAITSLDAFMKKHPARADELLKMVITSLQDRIDRDEGSAKKEIFDRWRKYVENYVTLAAKLYARVKQQPLTQRYAITQTYADALIKNRQYAEALDMFLKCQAYDKAISEEKQQEIIDEFKPMHKRAADAKTYKDLSWCREALRKTITAYNVNVKTNAIRLGGDVMEMDGALAALKGMTQDQRDAAPGKQRIADASKAAVKAFGRLEKRVKGGVKVQALNVLGLARAYKGRGDERKKAGATKDMQADYDLALKYFRDIVSARWDMSIGAQARMKWLGELGYCDCVLAAMSKNKQAIRDVLRRIRVLRHGDDMMGGYRDRFMDIRARAEALR